MNKRKLIIPILSLIISFGCKTKSESVIDSNDVIRENTNPLEGLFEKDLHPFYYGVASGDPLSDAVIIWTRIEPDKDLRPIEVKWELSKDSLFKSLDKTGTMTATSEKDFTIKVDVEGLDSGTFYYYRFKYNGKTSIKGRTKTASKRTNDLKFGIVSCSNYEWGFFNAYARLAEEELDAIIHLGDYIYEYGGRVYGDSLETRTNIPDHEIVSLDDYRTRYAHYHLDKDLMAAHQKHPFIPIWDDHEIANNAYMTGAQNHQENEGDYEVRKAIAKQVYYEWMPIRETKNHYRKFNYGELAEIFMLDERLAGRTQQLARKNPESLSESHKILGDVQFTWLEDNLLNSKAKWKIIGNQVIFSYQKFDNPDRQFNVDSWNGYPVDQSRLVNFLKSNSIKNTVFVSGDTHSAWAFEVTDNPYENYNSETSDGSVAVEFGTTSINSANLNENNPDSVVVAHETRMMSKSLNPHLKYVNRRDHGYLLLTLNKEKIKAVYKIVPTNKKRVKGISTDKIFEVNDGSAILIRVN